MERSLERGMKAAEMTAVAEEGVGEGAAIGDDGVGAAVGLVARSNPVEVVRRGVGVGEEEAAVAMMLALTQVAEEAGDLPGRAIEK